MMHKALRMVVRRAARAALRSTTVMNVASAIIAVPLCTTLAIALLFVWKESA